MGKCLPCLLYLGGAYEAEHQCKFGKKENFFVFFASAETSHLEIWWRELQRRQLEA